MDRHHQEPTRILEFLFILDGISMFFHKPLQDGLVKDLKLNALSLALANGKLDPKPRKQHGFQGVNCFIRPWTAYQTTAEGCNLSLSFCSWEEARFESITEIGTQDWCIPGSSNRHRTAAEQRSTLCAFWVPPLEPTGWPCGANWSCKHFTRMAQEIAKQFWKHSSDRCW